MIGTLLGPYRVLRELGAGGMGRAYAAKVEGRAPGLPAGTVVALKVVHPHLLEAPGAFKRFLREADIGKSVVHENVVRTYDCDSLVAEGGARVDFLVMEYVEGQTLRDLLGELERIPEDLARHIAREVARGLAAIHAAGVVHRDIKPDNVLITREHGVKVMDLGIARLQEETVRLSHTGHFVGSLHYAAPECFAESGAVADHRADLHSLGLVLYELTTGTNPYAADDVPQTLRRILHDAPRRLGNVSPQVSPFFEEVVHTLLAKDPAVRFADAAALATVLDEGERSAWWKARARLIRAETKKALRRIRIPRETAVFGREWELARLRALHDRAASGDGQVAILQGEAGVGKSRLLDEFVGLLQADGHDVHFLFGSYPPGGAATARGAFSTAYREHFGDDSLEAALAGRLGVATALAPAFAALLRGAPPPGEPLTRDALQTCFVHATRSLAAERTTIVAIDDLQFAPEEGLAMFASLATAVAGHRILLVGTMRPGLDEKWIAGMERIGASRLALRRLGPSDVARLLRDALGSERTAEEIAFRVILKSDGNPFFVFEILRGLREGKFLERRDDGSWATTGRIAEIEIPSSVRELVNARVADLDQEDRDLLDVAACCGFEFDPAVVAAAAGIPLLSALKRFASMERVHRLVRAAGRKLVFDHHQVQEALYSSLYEQTREAYHAALAEVLASPGGAAPDGALATDLAEHFLRGGQGARALPYLDAALAHLEKGCLNDAAVRLADRALAAPGLLSGVARFSLLLRKVERLELLGRREEQERALAEAETIAAADGSPAQRARVLARRGRHLASGNSPADAEKTLLAACEAARALGDAAMEGAVVNSLGVLCHRTSRYTEATSYFERALRLTRQTGDRRGEAGALVNLGNVHRQISKFDMATAYFTEGRDIAQACGHRQFEANATGGLGNVMTGLDRHDEARELYEQHLALAREIGDRRGEAAAIGNLGGSLRALGRLAEAVECHERQLSLAREAQDRRDESIALVNLGPLRLTLGDPTRAQDDLYAALAHARAVGARYPEGFALHGLGRLATETGNPERAILRFEEALELRRALGNADAIADTLAELGEIVRTGGDFDRAGVVLREAASLAREHGRTGVLALALGSLAGVPGTDRSVAAEAAAAADRGTGDVADRMRARLRLYRATGDRAHLDAARAHLDRLVAGAPAACRGPMLTDVGAHREIMALAAS